MMLVGAVALYDATIGNNPTQNAGVVGALVLFVVVPGFLLWRKKPEAKP